jgi:hypothetical protein
VLAEFTLDPQATKKLAKIEAAQAAQAARGGGRGGGALTKAQLEGQIKKLKKATVKAVQDGDPQRAAALKKRWSAQERFLPRRRRAAPPAPNHRLANTFPRVCSLELMEQQKTAPDVAPPQESAEPGDDGEVRDDDPMLLDVLGEIGMVGACPRELSAPRAASGLVPLTQFPCGLTRWRQCRGRCCAVSSWADQGGCARSEAQGTRAQKLRRHGRVPCLARSGGGDGGPH